MIIDHRERTLTVSKNNLLDSKKEISLSNLNLDGTIYYSVIENEGYKGKQLDNKIHHDITITFKSYTPAYEYLSLFKYDDYKVVTNAKYNKEEE